MALNSHERDVHARTSASRLGPTEAAAAPPRRCGVSARARLEKSNRRSPKTPMREASHWMPPRPSLRLCCLAYAHTRFTVAVHHQTHDTRPSSARDVRCRRPTGRGTYTRAVFWPRRQKPEDAQHHHLHIALIRLILGELFPFDVSVTPSSSQEAEGRCLHGGVYLFAVCHTQPPAHRGACGEAVRGNRL